MNATEGLSVAILETDAVLCLSLEMAFESWGMGLVRGESPAALMETVRRSGCRPDVLVVNLGHGRDAVLPAIIDGLRTALGHAVPVILTTGSRLRKGSAASLEQDWLLLEKPYDPDALKDAVASIAGRSPAGASRQTS